MHIVLITLAAIVGLIWACVAFPTFRIVVAILAVLVVGSIVVAKNNAAQKKATDEAAATAESERNEARQQELWSRVPPYQAELRDATMVAPTYGSEYTLTASVKNLSNQKIGALEIEITARDCLAQRGCDIIGHSTDTVYVDIPPNEVRGISGRATLSNMPQLHGTLAWNFNVQRVYAGDILDMYGVHR